MMGSHQAFAKFMDSVLEAKAALNLRHHQDAFFRGHSRNHYTLLPSLFRQPAPRGENDFYWRLERRTFFEFRTLARELYSESRRDWDVLFHMQHHGVPTRLLDWTSVFGVALYFAVFDPHRTEESVPCIWLLSPYALNYAVWNTHNLFNPTYLARDERNSRSYDFGELLLEAHREAKHMNWERLPWDKPLAIYDNQRSDRMFAQSGWFTIHGTNLAPLEEIFPDTPTILNKVDIPIEAIPAAKEFLKLAGIGHRQIFPGLDGLAKSVNERFGIAR